MWTLPAKSPRRRVDGLAPGEIWLSLVSAPRTISFLCSCKVDDKLLRPNLDARNVTADEAAIVDRCRQLETLPNRSDDERPRSRLPGTELTLPTRSGWPWRRSLPGRLWRAATTDAPPRATGRRGRISKQPSRPMRRLEPSSNFDGPKSARLVSSMWAASSRISSDSLMSATSKSSFPPRAPHRVARRRAENALAEGSSMIGLSRLAMTIRPMPTIFLSRFASRTTAKASCPILSVGAM